MTGKRQKTINMSLDDIVSMLHTSPKALEAFEKAYTTQVLNRTSDNFFKVNSRQAQKLSKNNLFFIIDNINDQKKEVLPGKGDMTLAILIDRIVSELVAETSVLYYDGHTLKIELSSTSPAAIENPVTLNDVLSVIPALQPQLTGTLMKADIPDESYKILLWHYKRYLDLLDKEKLNPSYGTQKAKRDAYNQFRQGLDILDLDPITYAIIGTNPNSMGYWFPALVDSCSDQDFFKIPRTRVAKVPLPMLQLTRQDYAMLTPTTLKIVNDWAYQAFQLDKSKEYFIKTGTYSSKFDFRNAYVHSAKEVKELGEYLLYIHHQALQMASPLCHPCIYGVSTTNEWVVREFIPDKENNPCIYKGLPLHTEYRVFVDCDTDKIIGISPYWEPETMKKRFGNSPDSNEPDNKHDYVIYSMHEEKLMKRYTENKNTVLSHVQEILPNLNLSGQWSIDVMQNGTEFWIIDMAVAQNSAFYNDCTPQKLQKPIQENWIPELPTP